MKKNTKFFLAFIAWMLSLAAMAQITGETCITTDGQSYPYHVTLPNGKHLKDYSFNVSLWGGIDTVSIDRTNDIIYIKSKQGTTKDEYFSKFGKGSIWIYYNSEPCGYWDRFDVYKKFDMTNQMAKDYGYTIMSPTCITAGDTMTVAVTPLVTMAFPHSPMDKYYWNFPDSLMREVLFAAVDSSSITFIAGQIGEMEEISVQFGQCNLGNNNNKITRYVYNAPDNPQIIGNKCVQWGENAYYRVANNTQSDLASYTWYIDGKRVLKDTLPNVVLNLNDYPEYKYTSEMEIVVQANPINGNCFGMVADTILVVRGLNKDVAHIEGTACMEQDKINTLSIKGTSIVGDVTWVFPADWGKNNMTIGGAGELSFQIPDKSINLAGQIKAYAKNASCSDTLTFDFYIKPKTVNIIGDTKIILSNLCTYKVDKPEPNVTYKWEIPNELFVLNQAEKGREITVMAMNDNNQNLVISVTPMGVEGKGCDGEKTSLSLKFPPKNLTKIEINKCLNISMETKDVIFTVDKYPGYTYKWEVSSGLGTFTSIETSDNFISGTVAGNIGTYTVKCWSMLDGELSSTPVVHNVNIVDNYNWDTKHNTDGIYLFEFQDEQKKRIKLYEGDNATGYFTRNDSLIKGIRFSLNDWVVVSLSENWDSRYVLHVKYKISTTSNCESILYKKITHVEANRKLKSNTENSDHKKSILAKQTNNTLSIKDDLFDLYPNPTDNFINIQMNNFDDEVATSIEIYNMDGKIMYKDNITESKIQIDISQFEVANYLVVVKAGSKYDIRRVVKQ